MLVFIFFLRPWMFPDMLHLDVALTCLQGLIQNDTCRFGPEQMSEAPGQVTEAPRLGPDTMTFGNGQNGTRSGSFATIGGWRMCDEAASIVLNEALQTGERYVEVEHVWEHPGTKKENKYKHGYDFADMTQTAHHWSKTKRDLRCVAMRVADYE
jgi:hypothetical protein